MSLSRGRNSENSAASVKNRVCDRPMVASSVFSSRAMVTSAGLSMLAFSWNAMQAARSAAVRAPMRLLRRGRWSWGSALRGRGGAGFDGGRRRHVASMPVSAVSPMRSRASTTRSQNARGRAPSRRSGGAVVRRGRAEVGDGHAEGQRALSLDVDRDLDGAARSWGRSRRRRRRGRGRAGSRSPGRPCRSGRRSRAARRRTRPGAVPTAAMRSTTSGVARAWCVRSRPTMTTGQLVVEDDVARPRGR